MADESIRIKALAGRVTGLYSLPVVAMEVVQLTNNPQVDAAALTRCIQNDPALTAKVLRVVNSSLFGLSREVSDLNQAVALLGIAPLKLLVLGFSLPDELFDGARKEQLQWYWTTSLTRAVAARQISKSLWNNPGDEAFLVALLQDIGLLALLRELKEAFSTFLGRVIEEQLDLASAEKDAVGFDHRSLSRAMLEEWNLPEVFVEAISMSEMPLKLAQFDTPAAEIAKVLHLAELLAQLVGQRRISVLPDLLEAGKLYRNLDQTKLHEIVEQLQPQVDQLAEVLSLDLPGDRDYVQILRQAHESLAEVAERAAGALSVPMSDDKICDNLLEESQQLNVAMESFLQPATSSGPSPGTSSGKPAQDADSGKGSLKRGDAPHERTSGEQQAAIEATSAVDTGPLHQKIVAASRTCRMRREELSLLLIEFDEFQKLVTEEGTANAEGMVRALQSVLRSLVSEQSSLQLVSPGRIAIVYPNCDRRQAVGLVTEAFGQFADIAEDSSFAAQDEVALSGAVATATSIFKNFMADTLIEGAERCLSAARSAGGTSIKSIEVL